MNVRKLAKQFVNTSRGLAPLWAKQNPRLGLVPGVCHLGIDQTLAGPVLPRAEIIYPSWVATRIAPLPAGGAVHDAFVRERRHPQPDAGAAVVPQGRILGTEGICFDENGYLIADPAKRIAATPYDWPELYRVVRPRPQKLEGRWGVLTGCGSEGFFHWMMDILPRVHLIQQVAASVDGWIVPNHRCEFIMASLEAIGLGGLPIHRIGQNEQVIADEIVVASNPAKSGNPPAWVVDFYRHNWISSPRSDGTQERIYISRRNGRGRRITNEDSLLKPLLKLGYVSVILEDLSLLEQANLFRNAQVIIAPHGAGLSNLVHCTSNTSILEIFGKDYVNVCFWAIANLCEMEYGYVVGSSVAHTESREPAVADMELSDAKIELIKEWAEKKCRQRNSEIHHDELG